MQWIEIKRDKDGFATEECLNEIFENALVIVSRSDDCFGFIEREDQEDWRGKIDRDIRYTHYLIISKVEL